MLPVRRRFGDAPPLACTFQTLKRQALVEKLISGSMQAYTAACGDKDWFVELDLAPSFAAAAWELIERKPQWEELQARTIEVFEGKIHDVTTTRALLEVTKATFADTATQAKVERALSRTYQLSLDECLVDSTLQAADRVRAFTKTWVQNSMQRLWSALETPKETLTQERVLRLFSSLVAPCGVGSPASCFPQQLIQEIGRPPREWLFLRNTIDGLFRDWGIAITPAPPEPARLEASRGEASSLKASRGGAAPKRRRWGDESDTTPP